MTVVPKQGHAQVGVEIESQLRKIRNYIESIRTKASNDEKIPAEALRLFDRLIKVSDSRISNDS